MSPPRCEKNYKGQLHADFEPGANRSSRGHRTEIGFRVRGGHKRDDLYSIKIIKKSIKTGGIRHHRYAHTDARSAKKDVISTKPQKAMGAERTSPREHRKKHNRPSLRSDPRYVSPIGARYPVQAGQAGAGGTPTDVCICGDCLQSRRQGRS